jgi:hypothetical protein
LIDGVDPGALLGDKAYDADPLADTAASRSLHFGSLTSGGNPLSSERPLKGRPFCVGSRPSHLDPA